MARSSLKSLLVPMLVVIYLSFALFVHAQQKETEKHQQAIANGDGKLTAGDHTLTVRIGNLERRYRIYSPKNYDASKATPVIVVYHGGGGNSESMIRLSGMNDKADEAGFLVVYPYGSGKLANALLTFNGGECCGYPQTRLPPVAVQTA